MDSTSTADKINKYPTSFLTTDKSTLMWNLRPNPQWHNYWPCRPCNVRGPQALGAKIMALIFLIKNFTQQFLCRRALP